jgi:hypothetical protein
MQAWLVYRVYSLNDSRSVSSPHSLYSLVLWEITAGLPVAWMETTVSRIPLAGANILLEQKLSVCLISNIYISIEHG